MHSTQDESDLRLVVARRETVADGVVSLDLRDPSGAELPAWWPAAHIDLRLAPETVRQYSLCGDPADRSAWRIGVLLDQESRGGSQYMHDKLHEGVLVDVRGPRNHFELVPSARYVLLAGGIGITPLIPMLAAATGAGARPDTLVYCCGPEPLLQAVEQRCADWPEGALHLERFAPEDVGEPVLQNVFEVELAQSGMTLVVPPGKSILEVVEAGGVPVLSSCQEGTCGTCETPVLDGEVDHRDSLLTPAEQAADDTMFSCVSRAACPRLVLDL